jgi:acetyl-CoA carboxylase carboxyltransferase component
VYYNRIQAIADLDERAAFVAEQKQIYEADVDLERLASEMVIDAIVQPDDLRDELIARFAAAAGKRREVFERRHGVPPV